MTSTDGPDVTAENLIVVAHDAIAHAHVPSVGGIERASSRRPVVEGLHVGEGMPGWE